MDTNKNSYTIIYAAVMVIVVALLLALVSSGLKETQTTNVKLDKKKQILSALQINLEDQDAAALYDQYIVKELVVNTKAEILSEVRGQAFDIDVVKETAKPLEDRKLPVYVAQMEGQIKYIIPLRGAGLWGPIWGYVALNDDKNTVFGTYFSHASETPGLGAEIALPKFQQEFVGKHILNDRNEFVSIAVMKAGQNSDTQEQVDAISGGTITSKGVEAMLLNSIGQYEAFLNKSNGGTQE
ncbi:MAG: NADH:ubiquinone reductase (Na(+)-transporting) subunit C [Paludibacter sp.]|jgi:Na+-transporting NADH:ubiquinone oxidoreductase subunit C|nr:NADH:ubiquinone reductase (Na(+)-transporting) subunit C [Paludibacter sp.]MBP6356092.1 NADH:ubiquinone reductase (Na(+)-transporting) subunit C [Paludibacter sp.]